MKIPGVEMTFDGTAYVVPPLNAAAVKQYRDQVATFFNTPLPAIDVVSKLLHASLARNYPSIKPEQVDEWVDFENMLPIMDAIMNTSGLAQQMGEMSRRIQMAMSPPASTH